MDNKLDELLSLVDSMVSSLDKKDGEYIAATLMEQKIGDDIHENYGWSFDDEDMLYTYANVEQPVWMGRVIKETHIFSMDKKITDLDSLDEKKEYLIASEAIYHETQNGKKLYIKRWSKEYGNKVKALAEIDGIKCFVFDLSDDIFPEIKRREQEKKRKREEYLFRRQKFQGDIIITDPCYVCRKRDESGRPNWSDYHPYNSMRNYPDYDKESDSSEMFNKNDKLLDAAARKWESENPDDWDDFEHAMKREGIECIMHRTLVGDWSCITLDADGNLLGEFGADSGEVGVFPLDKVRVYNNKFDESLISRGLATVIEDFDGEVWFEKLDSETLIVRGLGTIKGKQIEFRTEQTGF